jgi:glucose/arabinose dehydrogenase
MPAGLAELLSQQEFTDLIAYLETLRTGGKPQFGAGISGPVMLPDRFDIETVTTGLTGATALESLPDGRVLVCEQTAKVPAQEFDTFQGKMLRINPNGSIPDDNPFRDKTRGKYGAIWAIGCRNPFTFAVQRSTGEIFINDVGGKFEEINRGRAGANYGWPVFDHGPTQDNAFTGPLHIYPQASISGGDFSPETSDWPSEYRGRYFFADFVHGWIKSLDPKSPTDASDFASGLRRPVDIRFAPDGSLYVLLRNAWVVDDKFEGHTGSLLRITARRDSSGKRTSS